MVEASEFGENSISVTFLLASSNLFKENVFPLVLFPNYLPFSASSQRCSCCFVSNCSVVDCSGRWRFEIPPTLQNTVRQSFVPNRLRQGLSFKSTGNIWIETSHFQVCQREPFNHRLNLLQCCIWQGFFSHSTQRTSHYVATFDVFAPVLQYFALIFKHEFSSSQIGNWVDCGDIENIFCQTETKLKTSYPISW